MSGMSGNDPTAWMGAPGFTETCPVNSMFSLPGIPSLDSDNAQSGQLVAVQKFFEGPPTCKCCINWVEKEPNQVPAVVQERYLGAAILVYKGKDHTARTVGGLKKYRWNTVIIQSHIIRNLITPILESMGRPVLEKQNIVFATPFKDLYFSYKKIIELYESLREGTEGHSHLKLLVEVMEDLFKDTSSAVAELQGRKLINQEYLWTLFPKGMIVFTRLRGVESALEVVENNWDPTDAKKPFLKCRYVCFDGYNFGFRSENLHITPLIGTNPIDQLEVYPLSFHENSSVIKEQLLARGRKMLGYQGVSFRECQKYLARLYEDDDSDPSDDEYDDTYGHRNSTV